MRKRKSNGMKVPIISRVKDFLTNESQSVPVKLCQLGISVLVFIVALILGQDKDAGKVLFFVAFVLSGIDIFIKAILKVINAVIINKYLPIVLV